jgi:hypothetical protein
MKRLLALLTLLVALFALPGLALAAGGTFTAKLSGASEVPAVNTTATGSATVTISADESSITYNVSYSGLSGPVVAGHIHLGAAGANGGVMLPFVVGPSPFSGTLTAADLKATGDVTTFAQAVAAIKAGNTYVNLHTAANQGGEIRGQLSGGGPNTATAETVVDTGTPWLLFLAVFALATVVAVRRLATRTA